MQETEHIEHLLFFFLSSKTMIKFVFQNYDGAKYR